MQSFLLFRTAYNTHSAFMKCQYLERNVTLYNPHLLVLYETREKEEE